MSDQLDHTHLLSVNRELNMSQRIPVQQINPKATAKASSSFGKSIVTRSYQGLFRNIRLYSTALLLALFFLSLYGLNGRDAKRCYGT